MSTPHTVFQNRRALKLFRSLILLLIAVALVSGVYPKQLIVTATTTTESVVVLDPTTAPMLAGTHQVLNNSPTSQMEGHIDGKVVAYSDHDPYAPPLTPQTQIRYYDFTTNTDHLVPGDELPMHPDISRGRIVFQDFNATGDPIIVLDTASQTRTIVPGSGSRPAIGGNTVAIWGSTEPDGSFNPKIRAYDLSSGTSTQLTGENLTNVFSAVSSDGNVIVWQKCHDNALNCDIYSSVQTSPGVFMTTQLTGADRDDRGPDIDGETVAYTCTKPGEPPDICFQSLAGGVETRLSMPGYQQNARVSRNFITFSSLFPLPDAPFNWDIFLYEISTGSLYRITNTGDNDGFPDISISGGFGRIVYSTYVGGNWDLHAFTFPAPGSVREEIEDVTELVESFDLPQGTENSLITKLQDALVATNVSDTATACSCFSAFINECQAQSGKKLTTDQATQLINSANQIKTELGCQ